MINKYLKELKDTSKMTMQQISEESGVPISTVERILNGKTEQPAFQTVCDIIIALNGSVDALVGIKEESSSDTLTKCDINSCAIIKLYERQKHQDEEREESMKAIYEDRIASTEQFYKEEIELKEIWLRRLFCVCVGLIALLICLIICDFLMGGNGLMRC